MLTGAPNYILPRPEEVLAVTLEKLDYLLTNLAFTVMEAIAGFILGNSLAFLSAVLFISIPRTERFGLTVAIIIKAMPIIALAPLFVIWFGNGIFGKVVMASLVCFFPMLVNAISGLKRVDPDIHDYLRSLSLSRFQILRLLRIPGAMPYIFAAAKTSSTISIVGAIIAELSGSDIGIGHILQVSIYQLETDLMFASILMVTIFGLLFYWFIEIIERIYFSNWNPNSTQL